MALDTHAAMGAAVEWVDRHTYEIPDDYRVFPRCLHDGDGKRTLDLLLPVRLATGEIRYFYLAQLVLRKRDRYARVGANRITRALSELKGLTGYTPIEELDYADDDSIGAMRSRYSKERPPDSLWTAYERVTGALVELRIRLEAELEATDPEQVGEGDYERQLERTRLTLRAAHRETAFLCEWIRLAATEAGIPDPLTGMPTTSS